MSVPSDTERAAAAAVAGLEQALAAAHVTLDLAAMDRILHPDYVIVQPGGDIETKAQVLDSYRGGTRSWKRADVDQLSVRVYGRSATVVGRWVASGHNDGQAFDYQARFLSVWAEENGQWRNVAYQSTEIPLA